MEPTYLFWQMLTSGDTFAVPLDHGEVTGIYGPLHRDEERRETVPTVDYDDQVGGVARAQQQE